MVKRTVLRLDKSLCYFAKNSEYSTKCQFWALPNNDNVKSFFILDLNRNGLEIDTGKTAIIRDYYSYTYILDGWFKENEGILVVDRNKIADLLKLMDKTEKEQWFYGRDPNYFFKAFDENKDGIIDSEDAGYNFLFVWQDVNQDMIPQSEEIRSLASFGVTIDLVSKATQCNSSEDTCTLSSYGNLFCQDALGSIEMHGITLLHDV